MDNAVFGVWRYTFYTPFAAIGRNKNESKFITVFKWLHVVK